MISSTQLFIANDTDAHFRAWAQWIHDQLTAAGLVQTADTGQINLATAVKPAQNAFAGYEIWQFADALQATGPVFIKIEYGTALGGTGQHVAIALTVGTGSNGSGTLIGSLTTRQVLQVPAITTGPLNCYMSGDVGRFCFALGSDPSAGATFGFCYFGVERTKDVNGADNSDGVMLAGFHPNVNVAIGVAFAQSIFFSAGTVPPVEIHLCLDFPTGGQTSAVLGSDLYTFPVKPVMVYPRNPCRNWVVYFTADLSREIPVMLDIYGANHTYLPLGSNGGSNSVITPKGNVNARLAMRYE